ncbi:ferritin [Chlamydiota bacterium]
MLKKTILCLSLLTALSVKAYPAPYTTTNTTTQPAASQKTTSITILTPRMRDALIQQISMEQGSSNLYLTFASYFGDIGLDGCEAFFRNSSKEETEHALRFYNLLIDRGEKFQLQAVNASALMPTSPLDAFTKLMDNEILVTRAIHNLYTIALEEKDYATQVFLQDFLLLQVQEEKEAQDLLDLLSSGPTDPALLLLFDNKVKEMSEHD